ncbi:hypothetical protein QJU23_06745 [Pasteurella atlantica]|uniref:Uncharacterized protein n=2 Tax=Pasteurellaceae TaxID=712 RepID=A0ACC6HMN8_9PAST|nr:hypothetical protein [Pasteurella atlantica]MDP8052117.1 hypothetical protein [Pasteurella atlantica]MDP8105260.1 hypothetical protein [Pasteurella atlantica]MDP8149019.1 hypothetical protein [Pasteurella atlantica]
MIDYYAVENFSEITEVELINAFDNKKIIHSGSLAIYNGSFGKPADMIFYLDNISLFSEGINFKFGNHKITIFDPEGIVINERIICIKKCSNLIWYVNDAIYGETIPKLYENSKKLKNLLYQFNKEKEAFIFYSW